MGTSPLSIDVYVAPMRPYNSPDQLGEGEVATWAPSSSTLISGPTEGMVVDAVRATSLAQAAPSGASAIRPPTGRRAWASPWTSLSRSAKSPPS